MPLTDKVWSTMSETFEANENLPLPERIVKTLASAETVGGDIRGKQSAAILIVAGKEAENKWEDRLIDLRVEDHEHPVEELSRLLELHRAYRHMDAGDLAMEHDDMETALDEYDSALNLFPENLEMKFWTAITLADNHKIERALDLFKIVFDIDNNWRILAERLPRSDLLNVSVSRANIAVTTTNNLGTLPIFDYKDNLDTFLESWESLYSSFGNNPQRIPDNLISKEIKNYFIKYQFIPEIEDLKNKTKEELDLIVLKQERMRKRVRGWAGKLG